MSKIELKFNNEKLSFDINRFAKQADASVMIGYEDNRILVTVVESKKENDKDFFPLIVNYDEKLYSSGKIPGNYKRREAQPSEQATLAARMIDRPIRPLFHDNYNNEVQIVCQVMAKSDNYDADYIATIGSSLALMLCPAIPFYGPVGSVNVGYIDNEFILNPTYSQLENSQLNLKLSGTIDAINMVEASSNEISEEIMLDALMFGHDQIKKLCEIQLKIINDLNVIKLDYNIAPNEEFDFKFSEFNDMYHDELNNIMKTVDKAERNKQISDFKCQFDQSENFDEVKLFVTKIEKNIVREMIIKDKQRIDGRNIDEIRNLTSEIDILPIVHGSSLFTRGQTQVLNVLTLGAKSDSQTFDGLEREKQRNFMLHYNFPPYSVGETGRMGAPSRRDIGHGTLALKALQPILPKTEDFPYTIRLVAEVLESNGSSSQASICSGSLALMAGGVPIKKHVAGIAMGLVSSDEDYTILTDIQGIEDHLGDMDFKVAGTIDGITAIQMDMKIKGINKFILKQALEQAKKARLSIIDNMNSCINIPKSELNENVEKVVSLKIEEKQIKDVIGRGGETINKIIEQTGVRIDIEEDGQTFIYSSDAYMLNKAKEIILKLTKTFKKGEQYEAKVIRIESFGAFVEFEDSQALLHISNLSSKRVEKVEDVLKLNDIINVEILDIDDKKRIKVKLIKNDE